MYCEAGERDREVEAHRDLAVAVILEAVDDAVVLTAPLAEEHLGEFERRRVDGSVAVGAVDRSRGLEDALPGDHQRRRVIAKPLQCPGFDERRHTRIQRLTTESAENTEEGNAKIASITAFSSSSVPSVSSVVNL
jgi:hypothetical protein